jgi:hypothetical protein
MTDTAGGDENERFSLVTGGPFNRALRRIGLVGADQLPTLRALIVLALLAWLPPALLAVAQSLYDSSYSGWSYFTDWTVHARYLIAIAAMVATERYADGRLVTLARHFRKARILSDEGHSAFQAALAAADRRSSSALAEGLILAVALGWSSVSVPLVVEIAGSSWEGTVVNGHAVLSWAGEATRFLSNPLFLFLVLRWFWWFGVWTVLLYRIARLPLQLAPLHADGAAGLGFLAIYPGIFSGLAFALSCVIASAMVKDLALQQHAQNVVWLAIALWLVFNLVLFIGPLLVFAYPLYVRREQALIEYGRLANQHNLAFHQKWIGEGRRGEELMGSSDLSAVTGLAASIKAVESIRIVPVDRAAFLQLLGAAGIPMLAVVATQIPLADILKWFLGKIL